jgi:putative hydrolase of the HAD superfamily
LLSIIIFMNWIDLEKIIESEKYDHYSFDFWSTIAFSNPDFKKKRMDYIVSLSSKTITFSEVENAFLKIGKSYNQEMEEGGPISAPLELYERVFKQLNINNINIPDVVSAIDDIFLSFPPLFSDGFIKTHNLIKERCISKSITSNTAFISGKIIKRTLEDNLPFVSFDFALFSDLVGCAKPGKEMFSLLKMNTGIIHEKVENPKILHIGDNQKTDVFGALNAGLDAFHINS